LSARRFVCAAIREIRSTTSPTRRAAAESRAIPALDFASPPRVGVNILKRLLFLPPWITLPQHLPKVRERLRFSANIRGGQLDAGVPMRTRQAQFRQ
jgi:hypothetical protein